MSRWSILLADDERRQRWFENGMAIIMSLAAILATWASFESARWGDKASGLVGSSSVARSDSNRYASRGVEQTLIDASVWLAWEKAVTVGQTELAGFLRDRFSEPLDEAHDIWLGRTAIDSEGNPINGKLPKGTPLGLDEYVPPGQAMAEELAAQAESQLEESVKYSELSGRYVLLTVLFALVLFFGSVATKFTGARIQVALGSLALVLLLSAAVRMLLLPIM